MTHILCPSTADGVQKAASAHQFIAQKLRDLAAAEESAAAACRDTAEAAARERDRLAAQQAPLLARQRSLEESTWLLSQAVTDTERAMGEFHRLAARNAVMASVEVRKANLAILQAAEAAQRQRLLEAEREKKLAEEQVRYALLVVCYLLLWWRLCLQL